MHLQNCQNQCHGDMTENLIVAIVQVGHIFISTSMTIVYICNAVV